MVSAGDFRNGLTIEVDGNIYQVIEFQHVKPGKGAAFVRTKLKDIKNGGVIERTFRPTEKCPTAHVDRVEMNYLYKDDMYHFMNNETFEQIDLPVDDYEESMRYCPENVPVKVCSVGGEIFALEPPLTVELEIVETEPGVKGNTATGATKPATVLDGVQVMVPLFVNIGDKIQVDTRTGEYLKRV
ncbi:MAG: elongation factor P [Lachnospiraceae bacterium]|jgi:elongation factor P|nr:elongation factor P [Lachnospiraceae bacterium]MEE3461010.1 elongation factor P [Lachnospiraceae bacterium]